MVMKCEEIHEMMPDLASGLAAMTPEIGAHLAGCNGCEGKLEEFRQTMALLDEWQAPEPSPYFDTRLQARLREEAAKQPVNWLAWLRRPAIAVSMAVALVAGTTLFIERKGTGSGQVAGPVTPGTAVSDLQVLDVNHDVLSDSDPDSAASLLDDLQVQND